MPKAELGTNDQRSIEALIAESEAHTEHLQRLLARMLHGSQSKQLCADVQTPKEVRTWWNGWAEKLGKRRVIAWNDTRSQGFQARLKSGQWDVKVMNQRLQTLGRFALPGRWFQLDWFLCSGPNFAKFIEGNYSSDAMLEAVAEARAQEVEPGLQVGGGDVPSAEDSAI